MAEERKTSLTPEEQRKTIFVEFVGGFRDGQILRSDSTTPGEANEIAELEEIIENTPEGPRFKREPSMERNHTYEVVGRQEDDLTIRVRFQYMGKEG
jgi:hypothetical protein